MARHSHLVPLILGTIVLIAFIFEAQGKPSSSFNRRKRQSEYGEYYETPDDNSEDVYENEWDSNAERNARRIGDQTFPPFPGGYDDYDSYFTEQPETDPPLVVPTTSETITNNYTYEPETEKPLHAKIVPWFKRQWGKTKDFVNKHYNNISG